MEKSFWERLLAVYNYNLVYLRIQLLLLFQLLLSAGVCNNNMEIVDLKLHFLQAILHNIQISVLSV